jgi:hypothetical protein
VHQLLPPSAVHYLAALGYRFFTRCSQSAVSGSTCVFPGCSSLQAESPGPIIRPRVEPVARHEFARGYRLA